MGPEAIAWLALGAVTVVAGIRSRHSHRALIVGRMAVGALFVLGGALVNVLYLIAGTDYAGFADASYLAVVRDTWASVVAPRQEIWIGLLVALEATAGGLVWSGGRRATVGLIAIMVFHVLLLPFGWFFYGWSVPMLVALGLLLREHQRELAATEAAPIDDEHDEVEQVTAFAGEMRVPRTPRGAERRPMPGPRRPGSARGRSA